MSQVAGPQQPAVLHLCRQFVADLLKREEPSRIPYCHVPGRIWEQAHILAGELERAISPRPLPCLPLPPARFRLGDGRELVERPGLEVDVGGRLMQLHVWEGPKKLLLTAGSELTPHGQLLHVALSYPGHYPNWKTIKLVREACFPASVDVMMLLPQEGDYVAIHPNCFHLWQCPAEWALQ